MVGRFFGRRLETILPVLIVFVLHNSLAFGQEPVEQDRLRLVANATSDGSRMIAVGISSLANLKIETFDIDVVWVGFREHPLHLTEKDEVGLGLVDLSAIDLAELEAMTDLRAVIKLWPVDKAQEQSGANTSQGHLLVASSLVSPGFIHSLLDMIQTDSLVLKAANVDAGKLDPPSSMVDLPLPYHQGVDDFLEASDHELAAASAPYRETADPNEGLSKKTNVIVRKPPSEEDRSGAGETGNLSAPVAEEPNQTLLPNAAESGKSFTLFFETDKAELDPDDIRSVAEACRYAANLPRARFIISGHTDTVGPASYNNQLAKARAETVANAIRNDPRFREALSVMEYGESNLAVATDDGVPEARNRRVELTIVEDP